MQEISQKGDESLLDACGIPNKTNMKVQFIDDEI